MWDQRKKKKKYIEFYDSWQTLLYSDYGCQKDLIVYWFTSVYHLLGSIDIYQYTLSTLNLCNTLSLFLTMSYSCLSLSCEKVIIFLCEKIQRLITLLFVLLHKQNICGVVCSKLPPLMHKLGWNIKMDDVRLKIMSCCKWSHTK